MRHHPVMVLRNLSDHGTGNPGPVHPVQKVAAIVRRYQRTAAGQKLIRIQIKYLAELNGLLSYRNVLQPCVNPCPCRLGKFPESGEDAPLNHIIYNDGPIITPVCFRNHRVQNRGSRNPVHIRL